MQQSMPRTVASETTAATRFIAAAGNTQKLTAIAQLKLSQLGFNEMRPWMRSLWQMKCRLYLNVTEAKVMGEKQMVLNNLEVSLFRVPNTSMGLFVVLFFETATYLATLYKERDQVRPLHMLILIFVLKLSLYFSIGTCGR